MFTRTASLTVQMNKGELKPYLIVGHLIGKYEIGDHTVEYNPEINTNTYSFKYFSWRAMKLQKELNRLMRSGIIISGGC